jgi:hypothetical protein
MANNTDFPNPVTLEHGIIQNGTFTNESSSHNWIVSTTVLGQNVYLSISTKSVNVSLYTPKDIKYPINEIDSDSKYLASWTSSDTGLWKIQVNDSEINRTNIFIYEILVTVPNSGYSAERAILLNDNNTVANFTMDHEIHYWSVSLNENQNGTIFLRENTTGVLYQSIITIYPKLSVKENPTFQTILTEGSFNYSWNAYVKDDNVIDYIIVIEHDVEFLAPIGLYNISFSSSQDIYSFSTARRLPHNQTLLIREIFNFDRQKRYYFSFELNSSRVTVNIRLFDVSHPSQFLDTATIEIYDSGLQFPIHTEQEWRQLQDGEINITLVLDEGIYYLVVYPEEGVNGEFTIHFEYYLPNPFVWHPVAVFICFVILAALPGYLIYLNSKGKWYRINQWSIQDSIQETYKFLKYSFSGIFNIKEIPNESMLIQVTTIPFKTFGLLNFVESSEKETFVFLKRIQRKSEWIIHFLIAIIVFDLINILGFIFFSIHLLPLYIANITTLLLILIFPTTFLALLILFINVPTYISYSQLVNRVIFIIQNYQESSNNRITPLSMDPTQAKKNINYVRVLWNQAKHAFKENNFELFVIRADASVKNLISTRFQQLVTKNNYSKPDFQAQVESLRKQGFDLPNDKKIAHFRNLRNRIVHSSVTLDEKESVDCFAYYSTFISRLGLRSS